MNYYAHYKMAKFPIKGHFICLFFTIYRIRFYRYRFEKCFNRVKCCTTYTAKYLHFRVLVVKGLIATLQWSPDFVKRDVSDQSGDRWRGVLWACPGGALDIMNTDPHPSHSWPPPLPQLKSFLKLLFSVHFHRATCLPTRTPGYPGSR